MPRLPPPASTTLYDMQTELRTRRELLYGQGTGEFTKALAARYGHRADDMAWIDVSACPYASICEQLSALYDSAPIVRGGDQRVERAVRQANHWGQMQRIQRDTQALREMPVWVTAGATPEDLILRVVYPDHIDAIQASTEDPRAVSSIAFWVESGAEDWERWTFDLDAAGGPLFVREIERRVSDGKQPLGLFELERRAGDDYPHKRPNGEPFIPLVIYHAALAPRLLDWRTGSDLVTGSIAVVLDSTAMRSAFDDASYRVHIALDAEPEGGAVENGRIRMGAGPGSVLVFKTAENANGKAQFHTLEAPTDVEALQRFVRTNRRDLTELSGIPAGAMTRTTAEVKSAASLVVSAAQKAALQRKQKPIFGPVDQQLLTVAGWVLGVDVDPDEWQIEYPAVALDTAELKLRYEVVTEARALGTMTELEEVMYLNPSLTEAEAMERLDQLNELRAKRAKEQKATPPPADDEEGE